MMGNRLDLWYRCFVARIGPFMILFLIHVLFIVLVGGASVSVVREHESNARVAVLLEALVLIFGSAAILHRWPSSLGGSFQ